jgi:4-amino-4-deoxy-L-arabinose transferase-like glycosyltransferase
MLAATRWSLDHPYGTSWDEAGYINEVLVDAQRLEHGLLLKLGGRILIKSYGRPPAYRPLALPFLVVFGLHTASARLMCLVCFALSAGLIYLATRRIDNDLAGAFAALVFALAPIVVSACSWLSTEGPLYLGTSAMMYYLFASWTDKTERPANWIGLGLAVGLGFLSKASFAAIAIPVLAFWFVVGRWSHLGVPSLWSQRKAGALALMMAAPWWILNLRASLAYTQYARGFVANSLGPPSLATWAKWFGTVLQSLLGHGLSILIGLVVIAWFRKAIFMKQSVLDPLQRAALGACACAGLPIVLAQLSGTNHLLRHISPAVIPLAIAIGVLADKTGWVGSKAAISISYILAFGQLLMIVTPLVHANNRPIEDGFANGALPWRIMARRDQWDWRPLQNIAHRCGREAPAISYLGIGPGFDPPSIEYPWVASVASTSLAAFDLPDVKWLWRDEDGPVDWQKVMDLAGQSDLVLTAPHYTGGLMEFASDNQNNAEFADRLSRDPRFKGPIRLTMGRFEPVEVTVFVRKNLVCQVGQE